MREEWIIDPTKKTNFVEGNTKLITSEPKKKKIVKTSMYLGNKIIKKT